MSFKPTIYICLTLAHQANLRQGCLDAQQLITLGPFPNGGLMYQS